MLSEKKSRNLILLNKFEVRPIAIILSIVICLSSIIGAFIAPITVFAWSATGLQTTIASIIMSLLLSTGTAPVNSTWVNTLNTAYGVESSFGTIADCIESGLLTETATGLVDSGLSAAIEATTEYTSLGLSEIFTTTASDVGVTVATGGANIATTAIEVGTAGTIAAFAGAAITGVGAGVLINHLRETFGNYIKYGFPMTEANFNNVANNIPSGYSKCYFVRRKVNNSTEMSAFYFTPSDVFNIGWRSGNGYASSMYNDSGDAVHCYLKSYLNDTVQSDGVSPGTSGPSWTDTNVITHSPFDLTFNDATQLNAYISGLKNGTNQPPENKPYGDIVTTAGNAYIGGDGNDNIAGMQPTVPQGYTINPVDMDDYLNFMNDANQNTEDGNTDEDTQGELLNDLINPLLNVPEIEQPVDPSNPSHPSDPEQPSIPDKPVLSETEIEQSLNLTTTPELKEVFPFCIPWDIVDCLLLFRVTERKAPYIQFTMIDGNQITLDFSIFDSVAELLRILEIISFIVGLAIATRYLIGAT